MLAVSRIRLLGSMRVQRADGTPVDFREWRTAKTRQLLKMVGVRAGQVVGVDEVLEALWPDVTEDRGRASLRAAVFQIRRALKPWSASRTGCCLRACG